ncbi:MAG TPA: DsbA family protein [Pseudomonadales bacterium]
MLNPASAESFDPWRSSAPLIVYLDVKSPYAFIARDPTRAMARELGIRIDWRPLTLNIPSYLGSARLDKTGAVAESNRTPEQWMRVRYAYRDARRYAAEQGYALRGTEKIWDTSLVHIAFWWARAQGEGVLDAFLDAVYPRFWVRDFDAEDPATVTAALLAAGADTAGFADYAAGAGRQEHDDMQQAIFDAGIFGVPGYVIDSEYYFGREHLPTVRWILGGRQGPAPDVANPGPGPGGRWR